MDAENRAALRADCERRETACVAVTIMPRSVIELLDALDAAEARIRNMALALEIRADTIATMQQSAKEGGDAYMRMTDRAENAERERDVLRAEVTRLREAHAAAVDDRDSATRACRDQESARVALRAALGATEHETLTDAATRVVRERDALRAEVAMLRYQQAPLVALYDEVARRARAAGWSGATMPDAEVLDTIEAHATTAAREDEREACAAMLDAEADTREMAAGQTDWDSEAADLHTRAAHLRGAAALIRARGKDGTT